VTVVLGLALNSPLASEYKQYRAITAKRENMKQARSWLRH